MLFTLAPCSALFGCSGAVDAVQSWELGASAGAELYPQEGSGARGDLWGESSSSGDFPPALIFGEAKKNCDMENRREDLWAGKL